MKKILYGTTALLAAGLIAGSAAAASPVKLQLGGYANWFAGVSSLKNDINGSPAWGGEYNNFDVTMDARISVLGETRLANGMRVGAFVETELSDQQSTDGNQVRIYQAYTYVDSAHGRVVLGKMSSIDKQLHVGARDVGLLDINESDMAFFLPNMGGEAAYILQGNRANQIAYFTPNVHGLTLAVSYASGDDDSRGLGVAENTMKTWNLAGMYRMNFQGIDFGLSAAATMSDKGGASSWQNEELFGDAWSVGMEVGMMGFTVGGGFKYVNNVGTQLEPLGEKDLKVSTLGVAFEQGPLAASVSWIHQNGYGETFVAGTSVDTVWNSTVLASVKYTVSSGVDTFATFGYNQFKDDSGDKMSGYAFVTGIGLTF
jgi:hypothetical protein